MGWGGGSVCGVGGGGVGVCAVGCGWGWWSGAAGRGVDIGWGAIVCGVGDGKGVWGGRQGIGRSQDRGKMVVMVPYMVAGGTECAALGAVCSYRHNLNSWTWWS